MSKYKVIEHKDDNGNVTSYGIAFKFMLWWIPAGGVGYFDKVDADMAASNLNGVKWFGFGVS